VETGASCSVFHHHSLAALNGFEFSFLLAAVDRPLLRSDFLAEFELLVDSAKHQVLQCSSIEPLAPPVNLTTGTTVASVFKLAPVVSSLLDEFPAARKPRLPEMRF